MSDGGVEIRAMAEQDLRSVSAIYVAHVGEPPPAEWRASIHALIETTSRKHAALVAVDERGDVVGYVVGEVRTWEFGSAPAGWITGLGVAPDQQGRGVARALLDAIVPRLERGGARRVRTMAKRDDVSVLRFFRSAGFSAGPYTELELELGRRGEGLR